MFLQNLGLINPVFFENDGANLVLSFVRLMFLAGGIIYLLFAFIMVRQIIMMRKTLITSFSPIVLTLGLAHLAASIFVLAFLVILL